MAATAGEDIAAWVRQQWDRADLALARERRDYWLNLAFIEGEQWVYWHPQSQTVAEFPRPKDDTRVRMTANRMQSNVTNLLAKLQKRELAFEVMASEADDAALGGARLGEHLLTAEHQDRQWEQVRSDELLGSFLGGTSTVVIEWDPNAGEQLAIDPETDKPVNEGQIQLSALAITEHTTEPGTRVWMDSRFLLMAKAMPPQQVKEHYGLDFDPAADAQSGTGPLQRRLWLDRGFPANVDLTNVFTYYERPRPTRTGGNQRGGRWVVVVNGKAILDRSWPFPFTTPNWYSFRQIRVPGRWTGHTMLNDARPLQVAYNHGISMLSEHMKLAGNARLAIPDSSGVEAEDLSDLPGEIISYDGMSSSGPHWLEPPNIPRWLIDHVNRLEQKLDDVMAVHDISRGVAPGDRNSGLALSVLAEKDETPTGLMAHDQSLGWAYIATCVLQIWESKVHEYRTTTLQTESGIPIAKKWTGKQLHGQTRASVPLDNVLPHSRVAMQAWVQGLAQTFPQAMAGIAGNPSALARMMDIPGVDAFTEMVDADVAQAQRENMLMEAGQIPSLDDKPFPMRFDNHAVHIAEHNRFRKSKAYMHAPSQVRDIIDLHVLAHETMARDEAASQAEQNAILPGAAAFPQAHEPPGSLVPPDHAEKQAAMSAGPGGAPPAPMPGMG